MNKTTQSAHKRSQLKLLLLQIRDQPNVRREEHSSFCQYGKLHPAQLVVHNVFDRPDFDAGILSGYDALVVGGASEASVLELERYPFVHDCIALMRASIERGLPVFASCFGYQLATLALGGTIVRDESDFEMGCIDITLTSDATEDILFRDFPSPFPAVAVHRERSLAPPPGTIPLAFTDACNHAFRVIDKPFWAFQFHPEVDREILIERLTIFQQHYTDGADHLQEILSAARETPDSNKLFELFIDRVLIGDCN